MDDRNEDQDTDQEPTSDSETGTTTDNTEQKETDEIVLSRSDIGDAYEAKGSLDLTRDDASGEDVDRFEERELSSISERTFTLSDSDTDEPEIIFSSAMKYQGETAAKNDLDRIVSDFEESGDEVFERSITSSTTATVVQFENDQGYQNVAFYGRFSNVVFYVVTSDADEVFEERAEKLFKRMLVSSQS